MADRIQVIQNICLGLLVIIFATIAIGGFIQVASPTITEWEMYRNDVEKATWKNVPPPHPGVECWRRVGEKSTICVRSDGL